MSFKGRCYACGQSRYLKVTGGQKPRCLQCRQKGKRARSSLDVFPEEKRKQQILGPYQLELLVKAFMLHPKRWKPKSSRDKGLATRMVRGGFLAGTSAIGFTVTQHGVERLMHEFSRNRVSL
jgi:hypothetical protein